LAKDGRFLIPMLDLIEQAQTAVDKVVDCLGRSAIAGYTESDEKSRGKRRKETKARRNEGSRWSLEEERKTKELLSH
jgi:hypothetical protein